QPSTRQLPSVPTHPSSTTSSAASTPGAATTKQPSPPYASVLASTAPTPFLPTLLSSPGSVSWRAIHHPPPGTALPGSTPIGKPASPSEPKPTSSSPSSTTRKGTTPTQLPPSYNAPL